MTGKIRVSVLVILIISFLSTLCSADVLDVPEISQEQNYWCWAGCSQATLLYYGTNVPQCVMADFARIYNGWGNDDCCLNPGGSICNQPNYMYETPGSFQAILSNWGVDSVGRGYALSQSTVDSEIHAGRPFEIRWGWTSGGGHFLVGRGVEGDLVHYMDPWNGNGYQTASYDWVVLGSDHQWTHSLQLSTTPGTYFTNWSYPENIVYSETIPVQVDINCNVGVLSAVLHYDYGNDGSEDGTVPMSMSQVLQSSISQTGGNVSGPVDGGGVYTDVVDSQSVYPQATVVEDLFQDDVVLIPSGAIVSGGKGGYFSDSISGDDNSGGYGSYSIRMGDGFNSSDWTITGERYVFACNDGVYLGFEYTDVYPEDTPRSVGDGWYRPDTSTYFEDRYKDTLPDPRDYGYDYWSWYRFVYYYDPMPDGMRTTEGTWTARSFDNGSIRGSRTFTVVYNLSDHRLTDYVQPNDPWEPGQICTNFTSNDQAVYSWVELDDLASAVSVRWDWYDPSGQMVFDHEYTCDSPPQGQYWDWYRMYCNMNINGDYAASHPGDWQVEFYIQDCSGNWERKFTEQFNIGIDQSRWSGTIPAPGAGYSGDEVSFYVRTVNSNGSNSISNEQLCNVSVICPVANFSAVPVDGCSPLTVNFTDQSTGSPTSWLWDFGDGSTSSLRNPSHTYFTSGSYSISLTVSNACGSDTETVIDYITVNSAPVSQFNGSPRSGYAPLTVNFIDHSLGSPTHWSWDFGDGSGSTQQNPTHTYTSGGTFAVSLSVSNGCGGDVDSMVGYIVVESIPVAIIDDISPNPAQPPGDIINFNGTGIAFGSQIVNWDWRIDIEEQLSSSEDFQLPSYVLTVGDHIIEFRVQDETGMWSDPDTANLSILNAMPSAGISGLPSEPVDPGSFVPIVLIGSDEDESGQAIVLGELTINGAIVGDPLPGNFMIIAPENPGDYTVSYRVQDDEGSWSEPVGSYLFVEGPAYSDFYVSPDGSDSSNVGYSPDSPFATIQHAINVAQGTEANPVTIHVASGMYVENVVVDSWESVEGGWNSEFSQRWDFKNDGLMPDQEFLTVITGAAPGAVVDFGWDDTEGPTLDGFTITNFRYGEHPIGAAPNGDGITCGYSSPVIKNCVITEMLGYGIYINCEGGMPRIINCEITDNEGWGILNYSAPDISHCTIANNGGGIFSDIYDGSGGPTIIQNCIILNNQTSEQNAVHGGGIRCVGDDFPVVITNCTIASNEVGHPDALGGGIYLNIVNAVIENSIVWGNTDYHGSSEIYCEGTLPVVSFSDIQGSFGSGPGWNSSLGNDGGGNIDADPLFMDASDPDPSNWDLHLQPDSPCIDMGSNDVQTLPVRDIDGDLRIIDGDGDGDAIVDIGADEFVDYCECDLNNDGSCNVFDWFMFIEDWGRTDCEGDCECDLNNDGSCNVFDWFIFIENWGQTACPRTLEDGLVAYYPLNGEPVDASGNGHDGIPQGVTPTEDRFGNPNSAYYFDGSGDYIDVPDDDEFDLTTFTLSAWYKADTDIEQGIIALKGGWASTSSGQNANYGIILQSDYSIWGGFEEADDLDHFVIASGPYNDEQWHFTAITYDGNVLNLYIDDSLESSVLTNSLPGVNDLSFRIGSDTVTQTRCFKGAIDDVHVYNRSLSIGEIRALAE